MPVFHRLYCNLLCDLFFSTPIASCVSLHDIIRLLMFFSLLFAPREGSGTAVLQAHGMQDCMKLSNDQMLINTIWSFMDFFFLFSHPLECAIPFQQNPL